MMPSSLQVLDHQLIFHIMYGLGQFHHRQNKEEERRGEIWQKKAGAASQKSNSCHTDFARSHMNIICLISSEPDRQIGQSEVVDSSSREVVEVVDRSTSS